MLASESVKKDILSILDQFSLAYNSRDLPALMALMADDADLMMIGTGVLDKRIGKASIEAQLTEDWSRISESELRFWNPVISAAGSVAWVNADAIVETEVDHMPVSVSLRLSVVLEQRADDWVWMHSHLSIPFHETAPDPSA